jgi:hypothetical protein
MKTLHVPKNKISEISPNFDWKNFKLKKNNTKFFFFRGLNMRSNNLKYFDWSPPTRDESSLIKCHKARNYFFRHHIIAASAGRLFLFIKPGWIILLYFSRPPIIQMKKSTFFLKVTPWRNNLFTFCISSTYISPTTLPIFAMCSVSLG